MTEAMNRGGAKAAVNAPQSKRFALANDLTDARSVWTAATSAPLWNGEGSWKSRTKSRQTRFWEITITTHRRDACATK
jgi:hypothetical protein